jgi:hypothetical protein
VETQAILKKRYYVIMLVVAVVISLSLITYYFFIPRTQSFKIEIDYSGGGLFQFQNEWYTEDSHMHIVGNPDQQNVKLRTGDLVVLRLLNCPAYAHLHYNYIFLSGSGGIGDVACNQITVTGSLEAPSIRARLVVPEDGYYTFELGVVNVDAYDQRNSIGIWTFSVTVSPP